MVDTISLARLDRLPPRRMGRRRHRRGLAEGPDAAARAVVQRGQRQGARRQQARAKLPRSYWRLGRDDRDESRRATFPSTPATNLLYGLHEALAMLREEGLPAVFARHERHAEATRRAVRALGPRDPVPQPGASTARSLTAVMMPEGHDADAFRRERARPLRHVARHRARQARRPRVPHRPSRLLQRPHAVRNAVRRRDGARAARGAAPQGRRRRRRSTICATADAAKDARATRGLRERSKASTGRIGQRRKLADESAADAGSFANGGN